jgi:hypothetical protein
MPLKQKHLLRFFEFLIFKFNKLLDKLINEWNFRKISRVI